MTVELLAPVIAASFVGSLHCAGMCGGIVAFYSGEEAPSSRRLADLAYHGGRLVTYVALGAAAGALGNALDLAATSAGFGRVAGVVAGSMMIVWGLGALLESIGAGRFPFRMPSAVGEAIGRRMGRLRSVPPTPRAGLLGVASGLLPCGWLYAFVLSAAGTGNPALGAVVMAAFWSGTVPILVGLGAGVAALTSKLRRHVPLMTSMALVVVGIAALLGRWNVPAVAVQHTTTALTTTGRDAPLPSTPTSAPCHGSDSHH